jgi:REP element-mobilizing transposase RayT
MQVNDGGRMVEKWWVELKRKFSTVETDEYRVMPNHFHGIIVLNDVGADLRVGPRTDVPPKTGGHVGPPLPRIIQWFKTMTTNDYIVGVKRQGWIPFSKRLWQRSYYEHVIRNEEELHSTRQYIVNNPLQWALDQENPAVS